MLRLCNCIFLLRQTKGTLSCKFLQKFSELSWFFCIQVCNCTCFWFAQIKISSFTILATLQCVYHLMVLSMSHITRKNLTVLTGFNLPTFDVAKLRLKFFFFFFFLNWLTLCFGSFGEFSLEFEKYPHNALRLNIDLFL